MHIPRFWARADAAGVGTPDDRKVSLTAWGWGDDEGEARDGARTRLARLVERVRRGDPLPERYDYGSRPLREEILQNFDGSGEARAILTRNRYGVTVLNTARLLFLDVDLAPETLGQRLGRLFGGATGESAALGKLRDTLRGLGKGAFRIYRTAAGFRAIALEREFDPAGGEAQQLMKATGTDPSFVRLCLAQKSFRARLTPKPFRCDLPPPPGEYPRSDPAIQSQFEQWLAEYEKASAGRATCRFLEVVGKVGFGISVDEDLVTLHDRVTRATDSLPLA